MKHVITRGASGLLFTVAVSAPAAAQPVPPSAGRADAPAPAATAAFGGAAPQPEAPPLQYGAAPPSPQPGAGTSAPEAPPPPQPAPAYAPSSNQPPTSTSDPPPERYSTPEPSAAADQEDTSRSAARPLKAGPYFGAWFGVGAPFGGDTSSDPPAGFKQGPGGLASVGWAFIPNFGIDAFFHYNSAQMVLTSRNENEFPQSSAYGLLYGLEARGIAGTGSLIGWASVGISFGSGKLSGTSTQSASVFAPNGGSSSSSTSSPIDGEMTFKPVPVIAFGAEVEVVKGLGLGPHVRWYITNVDSACKTRSETTQVGFDPFGNPVTRDVTSTSCAENTSSLTVPDIVFLGLGLTYRAGM